MNHYPWLDEFLLAQPGASKDYKPEWEWFRYLVGGKMFAAVCTPDPKHRPHAGRTMVILKCDPELAQLYRVQYPDVTPGFYCNKEHWNCVYLNGAVPEATLRAMCVQSYQLVLRGLPKRVRESVGQGD